ncbi:6-bladed beta-propeller [Geomonas limicola]|nr:6-bladed beta-propeller [Geomonas limicola]
MKHRNFRHLAIALLWTLLSAAPALAGSLTVTYLYNLSDFNGVVPYDSARVVLDEVNSESFVVSGGSIDIYNASGMQVFHIDSDRELGGVYDAAVDETGNILLLTYKDGIYSIVTCNYRGEPYKSAALKNLPPEFEDFRPSRIAYRNGKLYLVSLTGMQVVVVDTEATFLVGYDFAALVVLSDQERADTGLGGFWVDHNDNMFYVIPALGKAYQCAPDGTASQHGQRGSSAGKFGVPYGIATDRLGNQYITDKLRGAVMVYDKDFKFIKEFGFRGLRPGNLIVPNEIAIDTVNNRVYVSQMRHRGVNVYQLSYE